MERTTGYWTPTIHEYLRHLERAGFRGAPSPIGIDEGWERLSYIAGEVLADPEWQPGELCNWPVWARAERPLIAAAELVRDLHECAAAFEPSDPVWREHRAPMQQGEIVVHGDLGPHNTVYRDGFPVAFIDWDQAHPEEPILELAAAAWKFVPLGPEARFVDYGWEPLPDLPERLGLFCAAYGAQDPDRVLWALQQTRQRALERLRHFPIDASEAAAYTRLIADELEWFQTREQVFRRGLSKHLAAGVRGPLPFRGDRAGPGSQP